MEGPARKRGFDIASLVDHCDDASSKKRKSFTYSSVNSSTLSSSNNYNLINNNQIISASLRDLPLFSPALKLEGLAAQLAEAHATASASATAISECTPSVSSVRMSTGQSSAFKKVDKQSNQAPSIVASIYSPRVSTNCNNILPPPLDTASNCFPMPSSVRSNVHHESSTSNVTLSSFSSLPSSPSTSPNGNSKSTSNNNSIGKSIIAPSLLPFLPPSLAALSFPHTNWCAKCNASFRMTSDLVYHMRSHHKPFATTDPVKKKREEKLRCNICGESFRERHHLTRHLTSHQ